MISDSIRNRLRIIGADNSDEEEKSEPRGSGQDLNSDLAPQTLFSQNSIQGRDTQLTMLEGFVPSR